MTDLSIIILNHDQRELLAECLDSILLNTRRISYELIVVDNGSTDGSAALVRARFPAARLIETKENLGFSRANNLGLLQAAGRYAMLLNNDTLVREGALDRLVEFMDSHPAAGACGAKLLNKDGTVQRQGGLFGRKFWLAREPVEVDFVIGAALLTRKEAIDQVGLLDENLFFYNDDLDWCRSIRKAGWEIFFVPDALVIHYGGHSSRQRFNRRLFVEGFRGGLYYCRKHYGEIAYQAYRLILILFLFLFLAFQIFSRDKFLAYLDIIRLALAGQVPRPVVKYVPL